MFKVFIILLIMDNLSGGGIILDIGMYFIGVIGVVGIICML